MNGNVGFFEVYDFYFVPIWKESFFQWAMAFFLLVVLILVSFFTFRFFQKREKIKISPWDWAILKLQGFDLEKCKTKKDFKFFYFYLTGLIKKYFKKRYEWQTADKTDEELLIFLEDKNFDKDLLNDLKKIKENAVWIKFAGQEVLKTQAKKDLNICLNLIEKTKGECE